MGSRIGIEILQHSVADPELVHETVPRRRRHGALQGLRQPGGNAVTHERLVQHRRKPGGVGADVVVARRRHRGQAAAKRIVWAPCHSVILPSGVRFS